MRERSRLLDPDLSNHEGLEGSKSTDWKILNGTQRLHAVQGVNGDLERAKRVFFGASLCGHGNIGFVIPIEAKDLHVRLAFDYWE